MQETRKGMSRLKVLFVPLLLCCSLICNGQAAYVKHYRPLCESLSRKYQIPASVILGVAIVESSGGNNRYCRLLNNHFGITGKNNLVKSHNIHSRYKRYPSARASFIDFCNLVQKRRFYKKLKGNNHYLFWVSAISRTGYSENPAVWQRRVISAIKKNKLE